MLQASDNFKQSMKRAVKSIRSEIIVNTTPEQIFTDNSGLISCTIESDGFLFGTAISRADIKLLGVNYQLVDQELRIRMASQTNMADDNSWEWLELGTFYAVEQFVDLEKSITTIKCYNKAGIIAQKQYLNGELVFPATVSELASQIAANFGLTLEPMVGLPNTDYQIQDDLWAKINNITYRDILSEIAGTTASMAIIQGDALRFLPPQNNVSGAWTFDNLKTIKLQPKYGPINTVVLARTPQEDNVVVRDEESILSNGINDIKLANNEILDDNRQELAQPILDAVNGFEFCPFEAQTEGHGYYEVGDRVGLTIKPGEIKSVYGDAKQATFHGYSILNFGDRNNSPSNGVKSKTDKNGYITSTGTATKNWVVNTMTNPNFVLEPETYTLSVTKKINRVLSLDANKIAGGYTRVALLRPGKTQITFTVTEKMKSLRLVLTTSEGEVVNCKVRPMLERGSVAHDWEPYVGGQPSPNPDYPQEVKTVSGEQVVEVCGKNLMKVIQKDSPSNGITSVINDDGFITFNGTITNTWANITNWAPVRLAPGVYTISINKAVSYNVYIKYITVDDIWNNASITPGNTSKTFTITKPVDVVYCYIGGFTPDNSINDTLRIQLEKGNTATAYEPYQGITYPLNLGSLELCKIGDYQDRIFYDKGWKLEKKVGKIGLLSRSGYSPVPEQSNDTSLLFQSAIVSSALQDDSITTDKLACNRFSVYNCYDKSNTQDGICYHQDRRLNIRIKKSLLSTPDVEGFRAWLSQHDTSIYYRLKLPSITPITDQGLIAQLDEYAGMKEVVITHSKLEIGQGIKETLSGVAPTKEQTDYARAGGIKKTIFNTEIKVDKQQQEIASIVSRQDQTDQHTSEQFTQIQQNLTNITQTVQTVGGGNLIKNSVGYGKNDGVLVHWSYNQEDNITTETSPASIMAGALSGNQINLSNGALLTQRLVVSAGQPHTVSFRVSKGVVGSGSVVLQNDLDTFTIPINAEQSYSWTEEVLTFTPTMGWVDVKITTSADTTMSITDLMLAGGDSRQPWRQSVGEIYNTQVSLDANGIQVRSSVYDGDYVEITPLEFAGYSTAGGTKKKVFSLNRDTTEVEKLEARTKLKMNPIEIIPLKNSRKGWAFVPTGEN